jgi:hypothetical protein
MERKPCPLRPPRSLILVRFSREPNLTAVVWVGKGLGTIVFEPAVRYLGYKRLMFAICIVQFVGVTGKVSIGTR